jgi:hypothetical protein
MKSEAWDSMKRVRGLLTVAKCFAVKGVETDDVPAWIAGTFATLLDLIENEISTAAIQLDGEIKAARAEANPADHRPAA